jgi:hypothetical protein
VTDRKFFFQKILQLNMNFLANSSKMFNLNLVLFLSLFNSIYCQNDKPPTMLDLKKNTTYPKVIIKECSGLLILILDRNNKLKHYSCPQNKNLVTIDFTTVKLKQLVLEQSRLLNNSKIEKTEDFIALKATQKSSSKNLNNAILELQKMKVKFALYELDKVDSTLLQLK